MTEYGQDDFTADRNDDATDQQIDFSKIKLIIWDLDETFWQGVLSEGAVIVPAENVRLIKDLTSRGIVNAICSKNDASDVALKLKEIGLDDYFVFNSVNWDAKGPRIKKMIEQMSLGPANVLFIDDNLSNLSEAKFYCEQLLTSGPSVITALISKVNSLGKDDKNLSRLKQYQLLEHKRDDSEKFVTSEDFLYASNIQVEIKHDTQHEIDRIYELVQRTNQLNFTKCRPTIEQLTEEIRHAKDSGYVHARDNYGDYGVIGFYLIAHDGTLKHFLFSCRTMGMGIEQYVYAVLGYPLLSIVEPVSSTLSRSTPPRMD